MNGVFFRSFRLWAWPCLVALLFLVGGPVRVMATDAAQEEVPATVKESMEALWTGKAFSPALKQKQQKLRSLLETGAVSKAELNEIMEKTVFDLIEQQKTSRYILKEMAGRIDEFLSPHLKFEEVQKAAWKAMAAAVKDGDQVVFKVGTLAPQGTPWLNVPEKVLIPRWNDLSHGKITMKVYGGGVMGEDNDIIRKIDIGQLEVCGCTTLGLLAASPEISVFMLPGLFKSYEEIDYISEKFRKRIDAGFEARGYILAALIDTGQFYIFSKNRVASLADLKKQKVLTCWGNVENALFTDLGISAIPVAVPEVVSALSTGLADTNLAPTAWMLGMQAYQYSKFYLKPPLLYSPAAVIMGTGAKARMQKQLQVSDTFADNIEEILVFDVNSVERVWRDQIRKYDKDALQAFETKTVMKSITLSAEDQRAIEQAGIRVREALAGKAYARDFMTDILNALEEFRKKK